MSKETTQSQDKWIWKRPGAYKVLELAKQGKSVREIAEIVKWREETVWHFMRSPTFLQKLEDYLKCVFFNFQKNRILALEEVSKFLWDVALRRKKAEGLTPEKALGHLIQLLKIREVPEITNPQQFNIFFNVSKASKLNDRDLAEEFGFADLLPEGGESET